MTISPRWIWRGVNGVVTSVFLLFAVVQYNDPDPVRWMAVYLAAALCCALELVGTLKWPLPAITALAALVWAGIWAPDVMGKVKWGEALSMSGPPGDPVEEMARELGGLLIVTVWCAALTLGSLSRKRYVHPPPGA